uniref:DNA-directed RNA polymerases II and V subunit 8A-like n=1 Tax=Cucumis melo TaxID=3656 RepID=A0A9I9DES0_CUCME
MAGLLFNDVFKVKCVNPDGKKYDKVSRIDARSEKLSMSMLLDVNTEIYPIDEGEKLLMVLSPTLNYDGSPVTSYKDQALPFLFALFKRPDKEKLLEGKKSLADKFEYIMHGKTYKLSDEGSGSDLKVEVYASFGGLQMLLKGDPINCAKFRVDQNMFLLLRKLT